MSITAGLMTQADWLHLRVGTRRPLTLFLHSLHVPGELLQCSQYNHSTISNSPGIIIIVSVYVSSVWLFHSKGPFTHTLHCAVRVKTFFVSTSAL